MKVYLRSLQILLKQIWGDSMLVAICGVPILVALVFRFAVPVLEGFLCNLLGTTSLLSGYYLLFDLFLAVMTPYMITFISTMVMLTELDENMAVYLAVTPLRKKGYIISRLIIPAGLSMFISGIMLFFFSLTNLDIWRNYLGHATVQFAQHSCGYANCDTLAKSCLKEWLLAKLPG